MQRLVERRYLLAVVVTAAAYYAAARIGLHLAYPHTGTTTYGAVTAFWPPVGIGIAALVLFGPRLWPAIVIGDLLAGDYSTPLGVTLGQTLGTVVAVVVAALLLIRLGARTPGLRVRDVLVLIVCSAVGTGARSDARHARDLDRGRPPRRRLRAHLAHLVAVRPRRRARRHSRDAHVGARARAHDDASDDRGRGADRRAARADRLWPRATTCRTCCSPR